jgi:hypothetical protein
VYTAGGTAGSFQVIATANGFADTSTVTVTAAAPTLVAVELTPASASLQTGGSQQFSVVGRLSNGSTQSVSVTYTATGGTVSGGGLYTAGSTAGSYRVIAVQQGGSLADTAAVTVTPAGSFNPPDIATVTFQGGDYSQLNGAGASQPFPGQWHLLDATGGRNGSAAMRVPVSGGSLYEPYGVSFSGRGNVYVRWYQRMSGASGGNIKLVRFHAPGGGNAGYVTGEGPEWGFDDGSNPANISTGLSWGGSCAGVSCTCPNLANGAWHSIEIQYDKANGRARFWCDGQRVLLPPGPVDWSGSPWAGLQYVTATDGGPTWISGSNSGQLGSVTWYETISQSSGGATAYIDDIAVSSQRIGP